VIRISFQNISDAKHSASRNFDESTFSLKIRLDELNMLCRKTETLKGSFAELWNLLGNLLLLLERVRHDSDYARDFWHNQISHEMEVVTEMLQREIQKLHNQSDA